MTAKNEGTTLLASAEQDAPFAEVEELQTLVVEGRERGFLTFEEVAACLEEVEVTKEQVAELHAYLMEHGIDVVAADGKLATVEEQVGRYRELAEAGVQTAIVRLAGVAGAEPVSRFADVIAAFR